MAGWRLWRHRAAGAVPHGCGAAQDATLGTERVPHAGWAQQGVATISWLEPGGGGGTAGGGGFRTRAAVTNGVILVTGLAVVLAGTINAIHELL